MMRKASATFLLLLALLGPLGSAYRANKRQPVEASDELAEAADALLLLAEKATELRKPANAAVAEIAPADKEPPAAAALSALPAASVPALRGTALPVAMRTAIPAAHAGAAEAPAPPLGAPLASASSTEKTSGLTSSSVVQQAATAMALAPQDTAAASKRDSIATTIEAFCGSWVEDRNRSRVGNEALVIDAYADYYWLDESGVLCSNSTDAPGQIEKLPLDRPQGVSINGRTFTKTDTFQHGHLLTTVRDPSKEEADSVLDLRIHNPAGEMVLDRWIDTDDKLFCKTMAFDCQGNLHTFTMISNRNWPEI